MTGPVRAAAALVLAATGFVSGAATVLLHQRWWGLALGLVAVAALLTALPRGWWARLPVAAGWAAAVMLGAVPRREGDYLVAADLPGYALLGCSLVLVVAGLLGSAS